MGKKQSGRKVQKKGAGYDKGPKVKSDFGGASKAAPSESIPRDVPRRGHHIHVGGHPKYGHYKGG